MVRRAVLRAKTANEVIALPASNRRKCHDNHSHQGFTSAGQLPLYTFPPLTCGGNVFSWTGDEPTWFLLLDKMVDAGLNFIDTADVYSRWARTRV